jgi:four helix bundle protein
LKSLTCFNEPIGCRWRCIGRASNCRGSSKWALADQIRRASKSICANLAEGFGRQAVSKPEFRRFVTMALGSADEMQVWTLYCRDLGYVDSDVAERWRGAYREIARMLTALYRGSSDL